MAQEQLAWAKEQFGSNKVITDKVVQAALESQQFSMENAKKDRARYEQVYQPLQDKLIQEADKYGQEGQQKYDAARAAAGVNQQVEQARQAATSNLESFGIDPTATRYAALDIGVRTQGAAAAAGAANQQIEIDKQKAHLYQTEASNMGMGMPTQVVASEAQALGAGQNANSSGLGLSGTYMGSMGNGLGWQGAGNQALGNWGNTLHMGYQDQLGAYKAENESGGALGSLLGAGLGSLGRGGAFGAGGALAGLFSWEEGGYVPETASPSGGQQTDDVVATIDGQQPARINAGEFIMPKDVVSFKGEEFFQRLIESTRKKKGEVTAKPEISPQRTALPMHGLPQQSGA